MHPRDPQVTLPKFIAEHGRVCDVMSIDGGHGKEVMGTDLAHAKRMAKNGALLLLDDMVTHREDMGRPVVEQAARAGELSGLQCSQDNVVVTPTRHRFATSGPMKMIPHAWCHARLAS